LRGTGWTQAASADAAAEASSELAGRVQIAGSPIAGSTVTLYAAGEGAAVQVAQGKSGDDGAFTLDVGSTNQSAGKVMYIVAKGGSAKAANGNKPNDDIALMTLLGTELPKTVKVNELTTVASAFTSARFISGESISGNPLVR
jgi:hypothetical protein